MTSYFTNTSRAATELQRVIDAYACGSYFRSCYSALSNHGHGPVVRAMAERQMAKMEDVCFYMKRLQGTA